MKKVYSILLMICIITPGFIMFTNTASSQPTFFNSQELYDNNVEPMLAAELEASAVDNYKALPNVSPWWVDLVDKENVDNDGEGVYIAVLDTGLLDLWPFFFSQGNIAWELGKGFTHDVSWDDEYGLVMSELRDDRGYITDLASGHGTHVTSTIIGYNYNNYFYVDGIAPKATIIPVLVLDAWEVDSPYGVLQLSGGTDEMISAGIYYIADLADELDGPVIINMSLGGPNPTPMIEEAINYAIANGVIIVCSAGNEGEAGMGYPGAYDQVISTAACGWTETLYRSFWTGEGWIYDVPEELNVPDVFGNEYQVYLEDFSSRPNAALGQKHHQLDVMAPGAWIVGPYKLSFSYDVRYYYVSGTSMSAPHVSAIAALILEDYPHFDQKDIEHILKIAAGGVGQNMLRGFPKEATDVYVAYYIPGYVYLVSWEQHDFGRGFLQCDEAMFYDAHYKVGH